MNLPLTDAHALLGQTVHVVMDRPQGATHPTHGFLYPVNYGYIPGTLAPDGEAIDAYVLGVSEPLDEFTGRCIALIHRLDDDDDKLIVAPDGVHLTDSTIRAQTHFQERYFHSIILRPPPATSTPATQ